MSNANKDSAVLFPKDSDGLAAGHRGRLKLFFGYVSGTGKTCAMLQAAQLEKQRHVDVVGFVGPQTRPQTMALCKNLELLAPLSAGPEGAAQNEFDLDAALRRRPKLLLLDELAHANAQGCRHAKRYQDVEELLKAGIDVYTTLDVQQIESLHDTVFSITGVPVQERVPDKVFDRADEVELIDVTPSELIERLNRGKIFRGEQAQTSLSRIFTPQTLTALQEIARRRCKDRGNTVAAQQCQNSNADEEHILVCLSSSPTNKKVIRTAARLAGAFQGNFTALFVETPDFAVLSESNKSRLRENIALAQQLGATIETAYGDDVAYQIAEFARLSGVSKIVAGKSNAGRERFWRKPPLTQQLVAAASSTDVYIIPNQGAPDYKPEQAKLQPFRLGVLDVLKSLAVLCLATGIGSVFSHLGFSETNIITVYILGVLVTAIITSHRVYSLVYSVISVLTFNFFFTVPRFSLQAYDKGYPVTFFIMFLAAFLTGTLAVRIKQHAQKSAQTAYRTRILLETNQLLQKAGDKNAVIAVTAGQLTKLLSKDIVFYPVKGRDLAQPVVFPANEALQCPDCLGQTEQEVAAWVFQNNKYAGATTQTLDSAKCLYLAVRVNETVYGVVGIVMTGEPIDAFENSIVLSILGECALALENQQSLHEREEAAVLAKNEQLRANLLRSISHDLRTPLTAISGNAGILLASEDAIEKEKRKTLYADIYDDSLWLISLVENLLSVTRIEDGTMRLHMSAELMEEVVAEALNHVSRKSAQHHLTVEQTDELIMAKMDARLITQVIINLVDNAVKYTPEGSEISIRTTKSGTFAVVEIADNGPGIQDEAKPKLFDMFYTVSAQAADSRRSLGLGLALCKSIINAHGGVIDVRDNVPHGALFTFTLPLEEVTLHE